MIGARRPRSILGLSALVALGGCRCSKGDADGTQADAGVETQPSGSPSASDARGWSAPIAAAHAGGGEVLVAGLDVPSRAIRMRRVGANDAVVSERAVLEDIKWSNDADLKVVASPNGAAVTWRGLRGGKLGRALVVVGPDLAPKGPPVEVSGPSCATREGIWFTDGKRAHARPWSGAALDVDLPREKEPSIVCGATKAFALLEEDDGTSYMPLAKGAASVPLLREKEFGEDEQRERAEFTSGDDLGVVRVAVSGALAVREVKDGVASALKRLRTSIPRDDDVVAVDASPKELVIVFTEDASDACGDKGSSTRVKALRIDRAGGDEATLDLSAGMCGREVGPFFTGPVGDAVSVAWVERVPALGQARAPIVALAHVLVPLAGTSASAQRLDVAADALVDAGCDAERCYAAALERTPGTDGMVPGPVRVLRYR